MAKPFYKDFSQLSFADFEVYSVLPEHPIWSVVDELVDFSFADQICKSLYSSRGQRPYAPSLKLKIHIIQRFDKISDRRIEAEIIGNVFYKRFLGLPVNFIGFDHSTVGLDRDRMGSELFDACHHHILAQAKQMGLWGVPKDKWLVDSFHTNGHIASGSTYRLVKQGILRLLNHLKRAHKDLYNRLHADLDLSPLYAKLPSTSSKEDVDVSFSKMVVLGYGILHWFEGEKIRPLFWSWTHSKRQLACLENQAILYQILTENVYPEQTQDPEKPYKKAERKNRPKDRIVSAADPDVRYGQKSKKTKFLGDKFQVVSSAENGIVLNTEPIPGNEADGDRLFELLDAVRDVHDVEPESVVADSAYGYARYRRDFKEKKIQFVSPLQSKPNPTGLYTHEQFTYDGEAKIVTCPTGIKTSHSVRNNKLEGFQFKFPKSSCTSCPVREQCTTNANGRTFFVSDYHDELQEAAELNETEEAKELLKVRKTIEPKNNELKNHHGLGDARVKSREKRRIEAKLVSMAVNIKQMVKHVTGSLTLGFVRKKHPRGPGTRLPIFQS
jgi:transposase